MDRSELKLRNAINRLRKEYKAALEYDFVFKPLAYALYQTWKYYDVNETPRKTKYDS